MQYFKNMPQTNPDFFNRISDNSTGPWFFWGLIAIIGIFLALLVALVVYIYTALALSALCKRLNYNQKWLAWIPLANLFLFALLADKKWYWGFLFFIPYVGPVFWTICLWKIFEKRGFDPKWGLLGLVSFAPKPLGGPGCLIFLIVLGVLAWKK